MAIFYKQCTYVKTKNRKSIKDKVDKDVKEILKCLIKM